MSVKLISRDEKLKFKVDDEVTIYYRRLDMLEKKQITANNTSKGVTDFVGVGIDMLKACIVDWDGIEEPCNDQNIIRLPEDVTIGLIEKLNAKSGEIDEKK